MPNTNHSYSLYQSATQKKLARELRKNQTAAEQVLWQALRNRQVAGAKFRRQHPCGPFILDFFCFEGLLAIEVDGSVHHLDDVQEYDRQREQYLHEQGLHVLRFSNNEVLNHLSEVIRSIETYINNKRKG